ncbi:hypothetical protein LINPERPRIM_LOCUS22812, partial [Linum perenne]
QIGQRAATNLVSFYIVFFLPPFIPQGEKTKGQNPSLNPTRGGDSRSPMAELAIPDTDNGGDGSSYKIVFIDTTLDTHLAMNVSSSETVADLKKRIVEEHPVCFPKCGEIRIGGLKVRRRGLYYHLAESTLMKSAFDGVKKNWFISVEACSVSKGKEIEGFRSYEEEAGLALVSVENNGLEKEEGVGLVTDVPRGVLRDGSLLVRSRNEASSSLNQSLADEVAETDELRGGDHGEKVQSLELVVGSESREEKVDEKARDMEIQATETEIDGCMLRVGDLDHQFDGQAQNMQVQVMETTVGGSVLQGDLSYPSNVKEKRKKRKRSEKGDNNVLTNELSTYGGEKETEVLKTASAEEPEVQLGHLEHANDDLVNEQSDKPAMEAFEHEPVAKKLKSGKEMENEGRNTGLESNAFEPPTVSQLPISDEQRLVNVNSTVDGSDGDGKKKRRKKSSKKLDNVVSEPNDMTFEPPTLSQLPIEDPQPLVNATMEGSDAGMKKRRKKKKSTKIDEEVIAVDQQSLKEAGGDNGNVISELNDMACEPPTLSQLPIVDEQPLMNATMEVSDAEVKNKGKKKSSDKMDEEVNADDDQSLKEAGGDNGNMVPERNDMSSEPPRTVVPELNLMPEPQLPIGDEQERMNATMESSDASVKTKRTKSSKVDAVDGQSLKEAGGNNENVVSERDDMTCELPTLSQLLVNATMEGSDAGTKKRRKKKSSNKMDKEDTAIHQQSLKEAEGDNLNVANEQQLMNATVEGSDTGTRNKRKKKSNKIDKEVNASDEQYLKEAGGDNGNMVSEPNDMISEPPVKVVPEPNDMTCEPPIASQLSKADEQQLMNATVEGSDAGVKKKRKKKSSSKVDKEVNAGDEQSLKEAAGDNGNLVEEPHLTPPVEQQEADFPTQGSQNMLQPSVVSLNEDTGPVLEAHHNNSPSQDINDFQKPVPDEMHETDIVVASQTNSIPKEVHSELPEAVHSLQPLSTKKRKKSKKNKDSVSEIPVAADTAIDNSIHEAPEKGSATPAEKVKEAVATESLMASLLVTEEEINEVIKNVVDSSHRGTESKAMAEVKEQKSKKKTKKKHGSDENTGEHVPVPPTVNARETNSSPTDTNLVNTKVGNDAEELSNNGVNFMAYFSPNEEDKKTSDRSEVTGAWTKTKGTKKRKAEGGDLDNVSPKLPEAPSLKVKRVSEAKPTHSESSTNSTSHAKSGNNKIQPLRQQGGSKVGRGSKASTGEVVNGKVRPKSGTNSVFKRNLFGDGSGDSLETYEFPSQYQSRSSTPDSYSGVSSIPDGDSDAGFDSETRTGTKKLTKDISLGDILKSSNRYKMVKLAAESQPEDFVPLSPEP